LLLGFSSSRRFGWSLLVLGEGFLLAGGLKKVMPPPMVLFQVRFSVLVLLLGFGLRFSF
jgi:hypothetical protein